VSLLHGPGLTDDARISKLAPAGRATILLR
jgi:hypothetical protein